MNTRHSDLETCGLTIMPAAFIPVLVLQCIDTDTENKYITVKIIT